MGIFREVNTIKWPVKVAIPKGDGTKRTDTEQFNITVRVMSQDELENLPVIEKDATASEINEFTRKNIEIIVNNIEGWDLQNLEYTPENLEKVMNNPFYRKGIIEAHRAAQSGGAAGN